MRVVWGVGLVVTTAFGCGDDDKKKPKDCSAEIQCQGLPRPCVEIDATAYVGGTAGPCASNCAPDVTGCTPVMMQGCDFSGHTSDSLFAYSDTGILEWQQFISLDASGLEMIWIENYFNYMGSGAAGATTMVSLTGDNADYSTCGLCVLGYQNLGQMNEVEFIAKAGEAAYVSPMGRGGMMSVTLTNVEMEPTAGPGSTWCIPSLTLMIDAGRFTCDFWIDPPMAGELYCNPWVDGSQYDIMVCQDVMGELVVDLSQTCPGAMTCDPMINPTMATCQ